LRPWLPTCLKFFRLGTSKAKENLAFRRHLSAHHVDEKAFQILASDIQQQMDCTTCANCCRHSVVPVQKEEIAKIASHLGVTVGAAKQTYTVADPEAPASRILRTSPQGCVFLKENLCTIYEALGIHSLGGRPSSLARWVPLCPIIYNAVEAFKHLTGYHPHPTPRG